MELLLDALAILTDLEMADFVIDGCPPASVVDDAKQTLDQAGALHRTPTGCDTEDLRCSCGEFAPCRVRRLIDRAHHSQGT